MRRGQGIFFAFSKPIIFCALCFCSGCSNTGYTPHYIVSDAITQEEESYETND